MPSRINCRVWMLIVLFVAVIAAPLPAQVEQVEDAVEAPAVPRPAAIQRVVPRVVQAATQPGKSQVKIETAEDANLPDEIVMAPEEGQTGRWTHLTEKKVKGVKLQMNNINTSTSINISNGHENRSCNISGRLYLPASLPIVHITQAHLDKATDPDGKELALPHQYHNWDQFNASHINPHRGSSERQHYFYCNLHGVDDMPEQFGLLEMRMKIYLAKKMKTHDIKIDIMDEAEKITDGLLMRISDVDPQTNQYKMTLEQTAWTVNGQPAMVTKIELIDAEGTVIPGNRWSSSSSTRNDRRTSTDQWAFNLPEGSTADKIRVHYADEFVVHTIKVKLKNVAVP